jgi:general secretion pathway protein J
VADRGGQSGFTLIEVLIAMAATVMIVTLAFMTFSNLLSGMEGLRSASSQSHEINRTWMFLSRDLRQFVNRPVRDELGTQESAFYGGELADNSLTFTRIGWHNPNRLLRSHMQRVRYHLEDEILWRESYPVLDRTDETEASRVELLQGVLAFTVAFLGDGARLDAGSFDTEDWPRNWGIDSTQQGNASPPQAVEIRLEIEGYGEVYRLFQVPGLAAQDGAGGG